MSWYFVDVYGLFSLLIASCLPYRITTEGYYNARMFEKSPNVSCDFETTCSWQWSANSFKNVSAGDWREHFSNEFYDALSVDGAGSEEGHFLFVNDTEQRKHELNITSPEIDPAFLDKNNNRFCILSISLNAPPRERDGHTNVSVLIQERSRTKVIAHHLLNEDFGWQIREINIGHPDETFRIIVEIGKSPAGPSFIAIDNIKLKNCFPKIFKGECKNDTKLEWIERTFQCPNSSQCIPQTKVCDLHPDCSNGMDEKEICAPLPAGAKCTFENGWCGWRNVLPSTGDKRGMKWVLNMSPPKSSKQAGPSHDHTFGNDTGKYVHVDMTTGGSVGSDALMESVLLNPPPPVHGDPNSPYRNSCYVTFFYHNYGPGSSSLGLFLKDETMDEKTHGIRLWWMYGNKGNQWFRAQVRLPSNITERYKIQFEARKSFSPLSDPAIDDISFSPACFGIGIPAADLKDYDYREYPKKNSGLIHPSFLNKPLYQFTTCGAVGGHGPSDEECKKSYNNSLTRVEVLDVPNMVGFQKWIVPETSFYTIIAKGARGGKGSDGMGESKSAVVRMVTELHKGQAVYMLIGQEGQDACRKLSFDVPSCVSDAHFRTAANVKNTNSRDPKTYDGGGGGGSATYAANIKNMNSRDPKTSDGGGGGGGATYVFIMEDGHRAEPLLVAAGGGGLPHGPFVDYGRQHGHGINNSLPNITAPANGNLTAAGAGGGWRPGNGTHKNGTGLSLLEGGVGGKPCYGITDQMKGTGGFGGGGGGCVAGGGGGGFTGGRSWNESSTPGEGGWSMVSRKALHKKVKPAFHYGPGSVVIIPAVSGCNCEHRCVALDESRVAVNCVCSPGWNLAQDGTTCVLINPPINHVPLGVLATFLVLICAVLFICILFIYNKYLQQKSKANEKLPSGARFPLNPISGAHGSRIRLTDNQIYEFGGETYTIRDLREIPREKVQLVKPLGCGAFGDVFQGLLRNRDTDSVDLAVAVKILPELSSNQAEADFLMEALIMSKFNHPNIVHFIGACFDTHPRYIILELLGGGDLKNFLRENRPKVDKPAGLTMKDLLQCAIDVAKGCQYLEELRFIHRDIAARNCLLTSRGPGRVVKIADFGMSRDIYRSDYYKKEGKAMLPIKWMPPEAFLDGIFSTKTDVWSFGVLLWEVMSLGFMPYTGIRNREVMMYVARGARLGAPANCPLPVFAIMSMCWSHDPDERPTFRTIVERLGYCIQDPSVISTQLPVYKGPLPEEIDKTLMRSSKSEEDYEQTDYMIPKLPDTPVGEWNNRNLDTLHKYHVLEEIPTVPLPMEGSEKSSPNLTSYDSNDPRFLYNGTSHTTINVNDKANQNRHREDSSPDDRNSDDEFQRRGRPFTLSGQYVKDPKI